jgi:hypothetical protein
MHFSVTENERDALRGVKRLAAEAEKQTRQRGAPSRES